MIQPINQTRRKNGVPEREVNKVLMKATQQLREHGQHERLAMRDYGSAAPALARTPASS